MIATNEIVDRVTAAGTDVGPLPTPCSEWSLHDVAAHCSGTLNGVINGRQHDFSPKANDEDVRERRSWTLATILDELRDTVVATATAIGAAGGTLDGIGIGVWVHLGDIRSALGDDEPYDSPGYGLALDVLSARARSLDIGLTASVGARTVALGTSGGFGQLATDRDTFVRLLAGRDPDPRRYTIVGAAAEDLILFG